MYFLVKLMQRACGSKMDFCGCKWVSKELKQLYKLDKVLGRGGYGTVMQATQLSSGDQVAVKIMPKRELHSSRRQARLKTEVGILRKMQHDNILKLHEALQDGENVYIVTELCKEGSMLDWLKVRENASEMAVLCMMQQALEGLTHLHENGIVHRDIKPQNIVLSGNTVKLIDFGLSDDDFYGRVFLDCPGTRHYQAPEMSERLAHCPRAADVWALGVTFYEILTGDLEHCWEERLFAGVSESTRQLLELMTLENPVHRLTPEQALMMISSIIKYLDYSSE